MTQSYNRSQKMHYFSSLFLISNSTCFGQSYCPSSGVLILFLQQMVFVILVILTNTSCSEYSIKTPDDGQ